MQWHQHVMAIISLLEKDTSRSGKESILRLHNSPLLRSILQYTYDPHRLYGVLPEAFRIQDGSYFTDPNETIFFGLLDGLQSGVYGREQVTRCLCEWESEGADLLWRVLNHDLRCGIDVKTINKVFPGLIFEFSPMLCHPFAAKRVRRWPVGVQWKRDGLRSIIKVNRNEIQFLSRTGRQKFASMPNLEEAVGSLRRRMAWDELFLDGELTRGTNFNDSSSIKSYTETLYDVNLHLFEILRPDEFAGRGIATFQERELRMRVMTEFDPNAIKVEDTRVCMNEDEVHEEFKRVRELGGEGIIVKQLDGLYYPKRGYEWMKMKGCQTIDLQICGAFEGEGKYKGMLGGFWVKDATGREICKVGGGFTDQQRKDFWTPGSIEEKTKGLIIEIEYQDLAPDKSLRSPVFLRVRDDKVEPDTVS